MSDLWGNIVVVLIFILIGGFFAAAELALVTLRDSQVARLGEQGRRGRRLVALTADPNRFLAAGQVGIGSLNPHEGNGIFGVKAWRFLRWGRHEAYSLFATMGIFRSPVVPKKQYSPCFWVVSTLFETA